MTELNNERLAELISDAMDCTKWDAETWRVVNTVTDHDDHMSTEQALALGNLISRQSHSTGAVGNQPETPANQGVEAETASKGNQSAEPSAWLLIRNADGMHEEMVSLFAITDGDRSLGWIDEPLYTHPKEAEVTVTEEMVERAARAMEPMAFREEFTATDEWFELEQEGRAQALGRARAALVAALSRKG